MSAAIITHLMREVEHLRDENELLRGLAFGELEYFEALAARWSGHLQPRRGHAGIPVRNAPIVDDRARPCQTR
jgi:hypothetical protein